MLHLNEKETENANVRKDKQGYYSTDDLFSIHSLRSASVSLLSIVIYIEMHSASHSSIRK